MVGKSLPVDVLVLHPLVRLEPGHVALRVLELQAEVPGLPQSDGPRHQVEQLLAGGPGGGKREEGVRGED